ncbi:MAG: hypothetical protein GC200_05270 [Tepidisphaera sp.]|nr:hypothetical protein [Tepidisphaera sp.]
MTSQHICPRCGYDLSGETSRWEEACPLRGRCPECGTEFEWELIFLPGRFDLPWFVEHGHGWREFVRRWPRTLAKVLVPPGFWREVDVTRRVSVKRALAWVLVPLVVLHVVASVVALLPGIVVTGGSISSITLIDVQEAALYPFWDMYFLGSSFSTLSLQFWMLVQPRYVRWGVACALAWPLVLALLPATRHLAKLRWHHLARAAGYSVWWVIALPLFRIGRDLVFLFEVLSVPAINRPKPLPLSGWWGGPRKYFLWEFWPQLVGTALVAWVLWWWWCACTVGWKIERGRLVWILLTIAAMLAGCVASLDEAALSGW